MSPATTHGQERGHRALSTTATQAAPLASPPLCGPSHLMWIPSSCIDGVVGVSLWAHSLSLASL